jgi:hypothetical protein
MAQQYELDTVLDRLVEHVASAIADELLHGGSPRPSNDEAEPAGHRWVTPGGWRSESPAAQELIRRGRVLQVALARRGRVRAVVYRYRLGLLGAPRRPLVPFTHPSRRAGRPNFLLVPDAKDIEEEMGGPVS